MATTRRLTSDSISVREASIADSPEVNRLSVWPPRCHRVRAVASPGDHPWPRPGRQARQELLHGLKAPDQQTVRVPALGNASSRLVEIHVQVVTVHDHHLGEVPGQDVSGEQAGQASTENDGRALTGRRRGRGAGLAGTGRDHGGLRAWDGCGACRRTVVSKGQRLTTPTAIRRGREVGERAAGVPACPPGRAAVRNVCGRPPVVAARLGRVGVARECAPAVVVPVAGGAMTAVPAGGRCVHVAGHRRDRRRAAVQHGDRTHVLGDPLAHRGDCTTSPGMPSGT